MNDTYRFVKWIILAAYLALGGILHRSVIEGMRLCPEYVPVNLGSTDPNEVVNRFVIED